MADNRAIFVYGAGISGQGVAEVLADQGEEVVLYNDTDVDLEPEWCTAFGAVGGLFMTEVDPTDELKRSKLMIISPGIPFTTDTVKKARELGVEIIGEAEEASRLYKGKWIGITGTNGKTTTTTLVGEMLDTLPVKTAVAGNIGRSLSKEVINLDADSYVAAELSSFQLEGVTTMRVNIALIVNITPDHFERHGNMENYINAKANIFAHQQPEDVLILNADDANCVALAPRAKGRVVFFSTQKQLDEGAYIEDGWFVLNLDGKKQRILQVSDMKIFGSHNEQNVLGALCCAYFAGVTPENMAKVLKNFQGVEHRLEYVTTIKGVPYYNDSKATNTDSAVKAMEAFKNGHVILLAGGHDKLTDLTEFMQVAARQTDALILLGEARQRFYEAAVKNGVKNIYMIDGSFDDAVNKAASLAQPPEVVLLSPACSSYDMFDNYPQRGRYFKELVRKLEKQQENA
ncbi:UDP-N-acetylmuramoyl-L-alanine--D-glutamate ligase [Acidaminococcus sp. AM05-11]|uniref:UDP-N-acetylmuramoyl-L-alanine--D-glutamate ligase n=1 Tax=Acidaminococcus sp. AM05-11 TaxID=2291997 RepID=UPI000E53F931|nr:UDP-N-acetylmuramoyl-L-alanine--D-glutamate ligase [Acidaminococcus sp. AM05-11]RHK02401.1 UDP-N-acetylmuramoyl-L-alanine--D-glutamate ligase [Acidaminococcus sp. AM05-11]